SDLLNSVIQPEQIIAGATVCEVERPGVVTPNRLRATGRNRVGMDSTKARTSGGKTPPSDITAPLKPKHGWATGRQTIADAMICSGRDDRV
ncbi:MAG: hypothetical protein WBD59_04465, partial [Candidatus Sulfotelmatobacter sp.]